MVVCAVFVCALLQTTSKSTAAVAACLTILSYVATAVVSGSEAIEYASHLWTGMPIKAGTILLLSVFALLNLMGISDSATVALAIFVTHLATMLLLIGAVVVWVGQHGFDMLTVNYHAASQPVLWRSIIFGFSSAMLGVSGFESSANFVEEQKSGVFVKTLRNMWVCVSFFNPTIALLSLCIMSQDDIRANQSTVLATMGQMSAGVWLEKLVSADAFLVLSGGVLTSFVGVNGLCRRLALDRCLPQFLLGQKHTHTHTNNEQTPNTEARAIFTLWCSFSPVSCCFSLCPSQLRTNGATRIIGSYWDSWACAVRCTCC